MRKHLTPLLVALAVLGVAHTAFSVQYPPGPSNNCLDTLGIAAIQDPTLVVCHPVPPDTVHGIKGIITGFDNNGSGRGFYFQTRTNGPQAYTGLDVFTGGTSYAGLALGDSVSVHGKVEDFQGGAEISGFDASNPTPDVIVRKINSGNSLPKFLVGGITALPSLRETPDPGNPPPQEQWEGMLVKIRQTMRVARISPGIGTSNSFLAVLNSCGVCPDSVFVDGNTLATPTVVPPPIGTVIDSVQGIFEERLRDNAPSYRIQLRNASDLFTAVPPNLADAFCIEDNTVRVIFDRPVTEATAEDINNYSLLSGQVDVATQTVPNSGEVLLTISGFPADGSTQSLTAENVVSLSSGLGMGAQTTNFAQGVMTVANIQQADPAGLLESPCVDRTRFAPTGGAFGPMRVSFRGVCTASEFTDIYFVQDQAGGQRSGVAVFRPVPALTRGRKYLISGMVQEFFGATEIAQQSGPSRPFYITDEGVGTIPAAAIQTVAVLRDTTCDNTSPQDGTFSHLTTGEDFEGVLVKVQYVKVTDRGAPSTDPPPGGFFDITGPNPTFTDSMGVENDGTHTYDPDYDDIVSVTGPLNWDFGQFRIFPRDDGDIQFHGVNVGVPPGSLPKAVSLSITPNPARASLVTFAVPQRSQVELSVFDISGRRVTTIQDGVMEPGVYSREWMGRGADGSDLRAGLYFFRLRVDGQEYKATGVKLR